MTKVYFVASSLLLLVLGTGCGETSNRTTSPTDAGVALAVFPTRVAETGWKTAENQDLGFSLRYPPTWESPDVEWTVLKGQTASQGRQSEISVMTSTNTELDPSWHKVRLSNGKLVSFSVDGRYIHLYDLRGDRLVILSAEANVPEVLEVLSTYRQITTK